MAVVSSSSFVVRRRVSGTMITLRQKPAAAGVQIRVEVSNCISERPNDSPQRAHTSWTRRGCIATVPLRRISAVLTRARRSLAKKNERSSRYARARVVAVVCLYEMLRLNGPCEDALVAFPEAEGSSAWGGAGTVKVADAVRREFTMLVLTMGKAMEAIRATTQTACRWLAGPWRSTQAAKAAAQTIRGICQSELSRNVSRYQLMVSIFISLSFLLRLAVLGFGQVSLASVYGPQPD
jgi:hypothetical protein